MYFPFLCDFLMTLHMLDNNINVNPSFRLRLPREQRSAGMLRACTGTPTTCTEATASCGFNVPTGKYADRQEGSRPPPTIHAHATYYKHPCIQVRLSPYVRADCGHNTNPGSQAPIHSAIFCKLVVRSGSYHSRQIKS